MKTKSAGEGGSGTASSEAAAEAADVSEAEVQEDGSADTLDEYLANKGAEPGVSQQSDSEEDDSEELDAEAEEEEAEVEEDSEDDPEEEIEEEHDGMGLDEEQKKLFGKIIDRKVGKQVAKRKVAEEALETAQDRITELESELERAAEVPAAVDSGGMSPVMLMETDAEVDRFESDTRAMQKQAQRWLRRHDRDDVLTIPGGDGADQEFSYDQIEDRLDELDDVLVETVPKARKQVEVRKASAAKAKDVYPALFDRSSSEFQAMQKVLRAAPQLKALPDYQLMVGRMLAGEAAENKPKPRKAARPEKPRAAKPPETSAANQVKSSGRRSFGEVNAKAKTLDSYLGV